MIHSVFISKEGVDICNLVRFDCVFANVYEVIFLFLFPQDLS